jgi:cytochrome c peroxidase
MKKITLFSIGLGILFAAAVGCQKDRSNLKYESESLVIPESIPDYSISAKKFPSVNTGAPSTLSNGVVVESNAAFLGRVLFYDKKLSINNTTACASCHHQENGFADATTFSRGFNGGQTARNSPSICNTAYSTGYFWDKRTHDIGELVLQPVRNHIEMGMETSADLVTKLGKASYYPTLFEKAYGSKNITKELIAKSLEQFLNSMVSNNSRYDQHLRKSGTAAFTVQEEKGRKLFEETMHCTNCHAGSNMNNPWGEESGQANIGLDMNYTDKGMENAFANNGGGIFVDTSLPNGSFGKSEGVFKVPNIRNVALSAPYMHDGRFKTLEEVVEHYSTGIQNHPSLDWNFIDNLKFTNNPTGERSAIKFNLKADEKAALVAFLKTLTDNDYIHDKKYSNPFQ